MKIPWITKPTKANLLLQILILATTLHTTYCMDRSYNATNVIMQTDVETVLIHTDIKQIQTALHKTKGELADAQLGVTINQIGLHTTMTRKFKIMGSILSSLEKEIDHSIDRLDKLFASHQVEVDRQTRAFEFLGDMLSGITGVPSARDHRRMLEEIKLLKLDNEGVKVLMASRNDQHKKIIGTISQHENKLAHLNDRLRSTEKFILNHQQEDLQMIGIIALMEKANLVLNRADQIFYKINDILMLGDNGKLSRYVISKADLGGILDSITLKRKGEGPVYGKEEIEQYYTQEISHSWTISENLELVTLIQIPIAPLQHRLGLVILDEDNKMTSDLTMAVINRQANTFRYLSMSDFHRCVSVKRSLVCQKRPISILPPMGCSLKMENCGNWATTVVHDITNTNFVYISDKITNITALCGTSKQKQFIPLPKKAVIHVPLSCSITADHFTIDRASYTDALDIDSEQDNMTIDIQIDPHVLSPTPIKTLSDSIDYNSNNLTELRKMNDEFAKRLENQRLRSEANWHSINSDNNLWYDIIILTIIGICVSICLTLIIWLLKTDCMARKQRKVQAKVKEELELANIDIIERIRHVETATKLLIQKTESQDN